MSTIYSLPTTIIQTNGSRSYRIKTKDYDTILQHVEVESKTNETINLNFEDLYFESIAFKGNSDLGETTLQAIRNTMDIKNYYAVDSRPITCSEELKDEYLPELQFLVSRGYVIDVPVPIFKDIKLDLNNAWRRCQTYTSPLVGWTLYESASNWHIGGASSICYLNIVSNDAPLVIYYCSYAEAQFDWLNIGFPDGTGVDTLRSWQEPPTSIDTMGLVEKSADMTGVCTITYQKDDSVDRFDDRGYILIPNDIPFVNEYVEPVPEPINVQSVTVSGPNYITEAGVYDYYVSYTPENADNFDFQWTYSPGGQARTFSTFSVDPQNPLHGQLTVNQPSETFDEARWTILCKDKITNIEDFLLGEISIHVEPQRKRISRIEMHEIRRIESAGIQQVMAEYSPDDADEYNFTWNIDFPDNRVTGTIETTSILDGYIYANLNITYVRPGTNTSFTVTLTDEVTGISKSVSVAVKNEDPVIDDFTGVTDEWMPWTDGNNVYRPTGSGGNSQVWNPQAGTWDSTDVKTPNAGAEYIWKDTQGNIYFTLWHSTSNQVHQKYNPLTKDWDDITWNIKVVNTEYLWTDGDYIYLSGGPYIQQVLQNGEWVDAPWISQNISIYGNYVWHDFDNIYVRDIYAHKCYIFDKTSKSWTEISAFDVTAPESLWSDGNNIYEGTLWKYDPNTRTLSDKQWTGVPVVGEHQDITKEWSHTPNSNPCMSCFPSTFGNTPSTQGDIYLWLSDHGVYRHNRQ